MTQLSEPVLVVGIGGAGSRLASEARRTLGFDCLQISNNADDFDPDCTSMLVPTQGVINPSVRMIRGCADRASDEISGMVSGYRTVIMMANLAGRSGSAIAPVVSRMCRRAGKGIVSFVIMPFGFERDRIFNSGVSLRRLRFDSDCTVIIDNDAILESNPDLSPARCYEITNPAVMCVTNALRSSTVPDGTSIMSASRDMPDMETSLRDAFKALYAGAPPGSVGRSVLHVLGADRVPVGVLNTITSLASGAFDGRNTIDYSSESSDKSKVVMVSSIQGAARFDAYDPLGVIPQEDTLDWDDPECSIDCRLDIPQIE